MTTPAPSVPQLRMIRPTLARLPVVAVPAGYTLRTWQPGWGEHWTRIIAASFAGPPERYAFDQLMRADRAFAPQRILFLLHGNEPVATASAWHHPQGRADTGIIHYVGVLPSHQGHRLGYWVCLAALHHMVKEHRRRATLLTDDFRLPAIRTYLKLGFDPDLGEATYPARWRAIFASLDRPDLAARYGLAAP